MATSYEADVVAWASEQTFLIRAGRLDQLDLIHIADEIEDVGKREQREMTRCTAALLAHLLKWQYQPSKRSISWQFTLTTQRKEVAYVLKEAPSLKTKFIDESWVDLVWARAKGQAGLETGLEVSTFPDACVWRMADVLEENWLPDE